MGTADRRPGGDRIPDLDYGDGAEVGPRAEAGEQLRLIQGDVAAAEHQQRLGASVSSIARGYRRSTAWMRPDTWRDVNGFALRFYTEDGKHDIVGNNTRVFFLRVGMKFPDFIHSQKRLGQPTARPHQSDP